MACLAPNTGEEMRVIDSERQAKEIIDMRKSNQKQNQLNEKQTLKMKSFMESTGSSDRKTLAIMIKADVQGSSEGNQGIINKAG
ncbi:MAG: hypothetical protein Ct9H300mP6_16340 [Gammaproteobacteria bacterium]|nr:MAG: hypothetical protein Ct9H300mP6_16340 [Gammaproteobacteria bacterium]